MYHKSAYVPGDVKNIPQNNLVIAKKRFENILENNRKLEEEHRDLQSVNVYYEKLNIELMRLSTIEQLEKFTAYELELSKY